MFEVATTEEGLRAAVDQLEAKAEALRRELSVCQTALAGDVDAVADAYREGYRAALIDVVDYQRGPYEKWLNSRLTTMAAVDRSRAGEQESDQ